MDRPASPVVRRRQLATQLRRLRLNANLTLEEAAQAIEASAATLSRIENGLRLPRGRDVRDLVAHYGVEDQSVIADLMNLATSARDTGWWEAYSEVHDDYATYIGLEAAATELQGCEGTMVPALLQTQNYARSILTDAVSPTRSKPFSTQDIEKRIEIRLRRQRLLDPDAGLNYSLVLDANVLSRIVGGVEAMHEQISYLIEISLQDNVCIRLVPVNHGAHSGQLGNYTILTLPEDVSDVVYVETVGGELFLESPDDLARHRRAFMALETRALSRSESRHFLRHLAS